MLSKRSHCYEIQKPISSPNKKKSSSSSVEASNSFNYVQNSTNIPNNSAAAPIRRSIRASKQQPRMGIPIMTSTPFKRDSDEPIYCEIPSPSSKLRPLPHAPPLSSGLRSSVRSNGITMQQGLKTNGAITQGLLGRRAITQLDMSAAAKAALTRQSTRHWTLEDKNDYERDNFAGPSASCLLKGVLWQQREKRFSRWKERFFIVTNDYLQCFRRGTSKLSEMGSFIYRIRLCEIEEVDLVERRGYLTLRISFPQDTAKLLLRKTDGIRKWAQVLQESISSAKSRKIKTTEEFWTRRQNTDLFETASCISETASTTILPNHLSRGRHLETASAVGRKSYNNLKTTHYGLIDWPSSPKAEKSNCLVNRILHKESLVNQSHDSGVDSMNTNSSGSVMSSSGCSQKQKSLLLETTEKFSRQITLV